MGVYKDKNRGNWYVSYRYVDSFGNRKRKTDAGAVSTLFCRKRGLPGRPARRIQMGSIRGDAGSLSARA
mgnify:CR=1 FL=1